MASLTYHKDKRCKWCGYFLGNKLGDTEDYHRLCLERKTQAEIDSAGHKIHKEKV